MLRGAILVMPLKSIVTHGKWGVPVNSLGSISCAGEEQPEMSLQQRRRQRFVRTRTGLEQISHEDVQARQPPPPFFRIVMFSNRST
jgi:hypothetical protein